MLLMLAKVKFHRFVESSTLVIGTDTVTEDIYITPFSNYGVVDLSSSDGSFNNPFKLL